MSSIELPGFVGLNRIIRFHTFVRQFSSKLALFGIDTVTNGPMKNLIESLIKEFFADAKTS